MATKTFEFGGIKGEGDTVRAARADAMKQAEAALLADYRPIMVQFREIVRVVVRTPTQWETHNSGHSVTVWGTCLSRREIEGSTRTHVAQLAWDGVEDESPLLRDWQEEQGEFRRWTRWQKAVKHYRAILMTRGMDVNAAERIACEVVDGWEKPETHGLEPLAA